MTGYKGFQEFKKPGTYQFYIPPTASLFYIEAIGGGGGGSSGRYVTSPGSGSGGGGAAYNSWMIRRSELGDSSFMNITVGSGGKGGNNRGLGISADTIFWTHVQSGTGFGANTINSIIKAPLIDTDPIPLGLSCYLDTRYFDSDPSSNGTISTITWTDLSGSSNNFTAFNFAYFPTNGGSFAGNSYSTYALSPVNLIPYPLVNITTFTISVTFKTTSTAGGTLFGQQDTSDINYRTGWVPVIYLNPDGTIRAEPLWTGDGNNFIVNSTPLNDDKVHTVTITYNSGTHKLYVDGVFITQQTGLSLVDYSSQYYYFVGYGYTDGRGLGGWYGFEGEIFNFCYYTRELTLSEIQSNSSVFIKDSSIKRNILLTGGVGGIISVSTDLVTWVLRTSGHTGTIGNTAGGNGLIYSPIANSRYIATTSAVSANLFASSNSIVWVARTSGTGTAGINAISFGSLPTPTYIWANTTAGVLATSTNTISWVLRTTGNVTNVISAILYTGVSSNYYLNCRAGGAIQTSSNAIVWISRTSGTTAALYQLFYSGIYVVSGASGVLNTSTDAITWTLRTSGTTNAIYSISYNGSIFLASGVSGTILVSSDAISWRLRSSSFKSQTIQASIYSDYFILGGVVSGSGSNGTNTTVTWTGRSPTGTTTYTLTSNAGTGAADSTVNGVNGVGADPTLNPFYSIDGVPGGAGLSAYGAGLDSTQNVKKQITGGGGGAFNKNSGGNASTFYSLGINTNSNQIYTNSGNDSGGNGEDGIPSILGLGVYGGGGGGGGASTIWNIRTSGFGANAIYAFAIDPIYGMLFACGAAGRLASSTDTITWELRTSGATVQLGYANGGTGLLITNNIYMYSGASGVLATSTDAIVWTQRTSASGAIAIRALMYSSVYPSYIETYYRANATAGNLAASTNGIQWSLRTTGNITNLINSLYYSGIYASHFILRDAGKMDISTDGISWSPVTTGTTQALYNMTDSSYYDQYSNLIHLLCVAGASGVIITSTDAITWSLRTSGVSSNLYSFNFDYFAYNKWSASGASGTFIVSTDSILWRQVPSSFGTNAIQASIYTVNGGVGATLTATSAAFINDLSYSSAGNGGNGTRGGGGGGGAYSFELNRFGIGGDGGDGYVRISWW